MRLMQTHIASVIELGERLVIAFLKLVAESPARNVCFGPYLGRKNLDRFVGIIKTALIGGATLTFLLAAVAGVSVTRRTVGRIETINATTRAIMHSGLGKRIPLRGTKDEWDQLAENLNAMLDRIEELVREVGEVSDNVAHDLRTPLARLRGRLENAYHDALDPERSHALVADTIRELDAVLGTFSSLLRISRIEGLNPRATFRVVDLDQVTGEVAELFDAAAVRVPGAVYGIAVAQEH